jgi:hypothetical protein
MKTARAWYSLSLLLEIGFNEIDRTVSATPREPTTLRNEACWPAKDAVGRSSAVAELRTATETSRLPFSLHNWRYESSIA